ncbi:MAG: arginine--tRNA ligase [Candidatus Parcubacteria bacterium]|jgi:arginyl-tRNA synthetase
MATLEKAKFQALSVLRAALPEGVSVSESDLVKPPQADMGDLSFPCFGAAKVAKGNPVAIAKEVAEMIKPAGLLGEIRAVGPYVNFSFNKSAFSTAVLEEVFGRAMHFGHAADKRGQRIMIEYGQANTHKEVHVGHLRNLALGLSVVRLARANGYDVIPVNYPGDIGAHVAKCLWALKKFHGGTLATENRGRELGRIYAEATAKVEENEAYKEEVAEVLRKLEAKDPEWDALWVQTRQWCIDELAAIFKELGCEYDRIYYESEVEGPGKKLVADLKTRGIAEEGERGALIVNLETPEDLGVFLVLKSDGASLYSTKELALAMLKDKEYPDIAKSVVVVDSRQSLYFKQLMATLRRMGFEKPMAHLGYEFVTLKDGAMSSRKGNIVSYEDFRDEMVAAAAAETRARRTEWSEERVNAAAWTIAEAAMKFGMLRQDTEREITFDKTEALAFEGFTGPYIQYAHARLSSILAKAAGETVSVCSASDDAGEYALLRLVADLPGAVAAAADAYKPSVLAQYLFELAQAASAFYRDVPVLASNVSAADRCRRLAITEAARVALENGLWLLGIGAPREM